MLIVVIPRNKQYSCFLLKRTDKCRYNTNILHLLRGGTYASITVTNILTAVDIRTFNGHSKTAQTAERVSISPTHVLLPNDHITGEANRLMQHSTRRRRLSEFHTAPLSPSSPTPNAGPLGTIRTRTRPATMPRTIRNNSEDYLWHYTVVDAPHGFGRGEFMKSACGMRRNDAKSLSTTTANGERGT